MPKCPSLDPHAGYRDGKLKFELRDEKLHGRWTLVRMRGREEERQTLDEAAKRLGE